MKSWEAKRQLSLSSDIRGSRVANAEVDIESAIAKATESGILWIIHGKGTGRLRQVVHEFLQRHPQVKKYQLAEQKEGGSRGNSRLFKITRSLSRRKRIIG